MSSARATGAEGPAPSPEGARHEGRGRPAPGDYWVSEGLGQLRLGLLWASVVADPEADPKVTGMLREGVLKPYLAVEWLPGVRRAVENRRIEPDRVGPMVDALARGWIDSGWASRMKDLAFLEPGAARAETEADWRRAFDALRDGAAMSATSRSTGSGGASAAEAARVVAPGALSPAEAARGWIHQALALATWSELRADLVAPEGELIANPSWASLTERCQKLEAKIVRRNREASAGFALAISPHSRHDFDLFRDSTSTLKQLREELTQLIEAAGALRTDVAATAHRRDLVARVDEALSESKPAPSPSRWLAELAESIRPREAREFLKGLAQAATAGRPEPPHPASVPPAWHARLTLAFRLVEHLDEGGAPPPSWTLLEQSLASLLDGGPGVELVRGYHLNPDLVEVDRAEGPARRVRTGLVAWVGNPRRPVPIRKVAFQVPPETPPETQALLDLAGWLGGGPLAELCREVAGDLRGHDSVEHWWMRADEQGRSRLWRLMQKAASRLRRGTGDDRGPISEVLTALESGGFRLVGAEAARSGDPYVPGPWFLDPERGDADGDGFGPVLQAPDGRFGPTVWVRLGPNPGAGGPLASCLARVESSLAILKFADPSWDRWDDFNVRIMDLAKVEGRAAEVDRCGELLAMIYKRAHDPRTSRTAGAAYFKVAQALHSCLVDDLKGSLIPRLDPVTMKAETLSPTTAQPIEVRWAPEPSPIGTVLNVERFQFRKGGQWPIVLASLGPDVPPELIPWLALPGLPNAAAPEPLYQWYLALKKGVWNKGGPSADPAAHHQAFRDWLDRPEGREKFHQLVELAVKPSGTPGADRARRWVEVLQSQGWCRIYPRPDFHGEGVRLFWPSETPSDTSEQSWHFDRAVARGEVIGPVERFAPDPGEARCTLSLGSEDAGGMLGAARAAQLAAAGIETPDEVIDTIWAATLRAELGGGPIDDPAGLVRAALADLVRRAGASPEIATLPKNEQNHARLGSASAVKFDQVLAALRQWCAAQGMEVTPRRWKFAAALRREELATDEQAVKPVVYMVDEPKGRVIHVIEFGLSIIGGVTIAPCRLRLSAGPRPDHLTQMSQSATGPIRDRLKEWPEAQLNDKLSEVAEKFFVDDWDTMHAESYRQNAEATADFVAHFESFLASACGLAAFRPESTLGQKPGSCEVRSRSGVVTGRVIEVIRPGLIRGGNVRVPAIVEAV